MKSILSLFVILLIVSTCFSCSNSDDILLEPQAKPVMTKSSMDVETFTKTIVYKGKVYNSICESRNDSIFYQNKKIESLLNEIYSNPTSVSFVQNEEVTVYFDSQEEFLQNYDIILLPEDSLVEMRSIRTKASPNGPQYNSFAYTILYDDTKFRDTYYELDITDTDHTYSVTNMKDHALNDKVSSLKVQYTYYGEDYDKQCALLTVWEDSDFNKGDNNKTKHRTNFVATSNNRYLEVSSLKKVSCWNAHDSWNDRISSLVFHLGVIGNLPEVY